MLIWRIMVNQQLFTTTGNVELDFYAFLAMLKLDAPFAPRIYFVTRVPEIELEYRRIPFLTRSLAFIAWSMMFRQHHLTTQKHIGANTVSRWGTNPLDFWSWMIWMVCQLAQTSWHIHGCLHQPSGQLMSEDAGKLKTLLSWSWMMIEHLDRRFWMLLRIINIPVDGHTMDVSRLSI